MASIPSSVPSPSGGLQRGGRKRAGHRPLPHQDLPGHGRDRVEQVTCQKANWCLFAGILCSQNKT